MPQENQLSNLFAEFGTTNVFDLTDKENADKILATLKICKEMLLRHAGPYAMYSMSIKPGGGSVAEFTRDGISIIKNLQFISPLENHIKSILVYIGELVDDVAKDNTTTSMLLAVYFLEHAFKHIIKSAAAGLNETPYAISNKIYKYIDKVMTQLKSSVSDSHKELFEVNTDDDEASEYIRAGKVAYYQTLSSSGGNTKLAEAMEEVFRTCPKACREYTRFYGTDYETKEEFIVDKLDYDYKIECTTASLVDRAFNTALGTECKHQNVSVIIADDQLIDGILETEEVLKYIDENKGKKMILIAPIFSKRILEASNLSMDGSVTCWQHVSPYVNGGTSYLGELTLAKVLSKEGEYLLSTGVKVVENVDIHWRNGKMFLYNFYPEAKSSAVVHPYYSIYEQVENGSIGINECSEGARTYIDTLREVLEGLSHYRKQRAIDGNTESLFIEALEAMTSYHRTILRLGGSTHTALANQSVAKDVVGAIMSSLKDGFITQGLCSIRLAAIDGYSVEEEPAQVQWLHDAINDITCDIYAYNTGENIRDEDDFKSRLLDHSLKVNFLDDSNLVLQPLRGVEYMLKCVSDLCLKVALSSEMTVHNGFVVGKKLFTKQED